MVKQLKLRSNLVQSPGSILRFIILSFFTFHFSLFTSAQVEIDTTLTPEEIVETFMGEGVRIFNVTISGDKGSAGTFNFKRSNFPMEEGIVLSTGNAKAIEGQNVSTKQSTSDFNSGRSDYDLQSMVRKRVFNPTVIEFDFIPMHDSLYFDYVFGSEEYPEYVGSPYNDVFCLLISGPNFNVPLNLARIGNPATTVMINSVNRLRNKEYFQANYSFTPNDSQKYTIEFDGFTKILTASCRVTKGKVHHLKVAVGNVNDHKYDSGVFLRAGSFGSQGNEEAKNKFIIPFDFDSRDLRDTYEALFDSLGQVLQANPDWKLAVLGHTDNTGSKEYNENLSQERADEVAKRLQAHGVSVTQMYVKGYNYSKPLTSNNSEEGRERNRRVEIIILRR